jgi:hypothetical protein
MTSSTPVKAATDGMITSANTDAEDPVDELRRSERCGLISLACDAVHAASDLGHEMHTGIYKPGTVPTAEVQRKLLAALTCLETAEHYLRMLDEVIDPGLDEATDPAKPEDSDPWAV